MHRREESESAPNLEYSTDEGAERGKGGCKENRDESYTDQTQSGINVSPGLVAVRQRAREGKTEKFTNLLHPIFNLL